MKAALRFAMTLDADGDGLTNWNEVHIHKTNPKLADTDQDWVSDGMELKILKSDPLKADTDGDGLLVDLFRVENHTTTYLCIESGFDAGDLNETLDPEEVLSSATAGASIRGRGQTC